MDECEVSCGQLGQYERAQVRVFCAVRLAQDARWFVEDQEVVILVCQTGFKFAALDTTEPDVSGPRLRRGFSPRSRSHKISERISLTSVGARTSALRTPRAARMISALALAVATQQNTTHRDSSSFNFRPCDTPWGLTGTGARDIRTSKKHGTMHAGRGGANACFTMFPHELFLKNAAVAAPSVALALPRVAVGSGVETSVETVASPAC